MARISVVTICYTVFLAYLYLICKGWQITVQQLDRNQATNLTMIMGATYLLYSAYFLSQDFDTIYNVMSIVIAILYLSVSYTFTKNHLMNLRKVNNYLREFDLNNDRDNIMAPSLRIKAKIIKWIMIGSLSFCMSKMVEFSVVNLLEDQYARARARTIV